MTAVTQDATQGLVSIRLGAQWFGVPVLRVQDVISQATINRVPLAPPEVAGSLNLRGRIVTAIDLRRRLGMAPRAEGEGFMCVIVDRGGELYALLVDDVGDVLWLSDASYEPAPVTLSGHWRSVTDGLHRLPDELLLILNIEQILTLGAAAQAA
jgi:purine-binding chemotaxis protein CheW